MRRLMVQTLVALLGVVVLSETLVAQEPETEAPELEVVAAKLGRGVEHRLLVGEDSTFVLKEKVYLWMRVVGGPADSIAVTWHWDERSYEYRLAIGGSPWRTWAYKTVRTAGDWLVTVADSQGNELKRLSFTVEEASESEDSIEE